MPKRIAVAYVADRPDLSWYSYSDLIPWHQPEFILLREGDLVLAIEQIGDIANRRWLLKSLHQVRKFEETGDAFNYDLELLCTLTDKEHAISRSELLVALNWLPTPDVYFKPLPYAVWEWLLHSKKVPLIEV